ncbi:hypothetical protein ABZ479_29620 [Streptomyces sp. NPDC005722]
MAPSSDGFTDWKWKVATLLRPWRSEFWLYYPCEADAGHQMVKVCERSGYDFAVLHFRICHECRHGLIAKIRVTGEWTRQGYATRMVKWAIRGCETYSWSTTNRFEDGELFFPTLQAALGTAFTRRERVCEHIKARRRGYARPGMERSPTSRQRAMERRSAA